MTDPDSTYNFCDPPVTICGSGTPELVCSASICRIPKLNYTKKLQRFLYLSERIINRNENKDLDPRKTMKILQETGTVPVPLLVPHVIGTAPVPVPIPDGTVATREESKQHLHYCCAN